MTNTTTHFRLPAVFLAIGAMVASLLVIASPDHASASHMELEAGSKSQYECATGGGNNTIAVPIKVIDPVTDQQAFADNEIKVDFDTVAVAPEGGASATPGSDYISTSGTVTIPPGSREGNAQVTLVCDSTPSEPNEQFTVYFYNPRGASFDSENDQRGIATIQEGQPPIGPHFVIEDAVPSPATEGKTTSVQFTIRLKNSSSGGYVTVNAQDGTAGSNDYTVPPTESNVKTFAPGENEKTFTVNIDNDSTAEPVEVFHAVLSNNSPGTTIARSTANAVIVDDDAPRVSVFDNTDSEKDANAREFVVPFKIVENVAINEPIHIEWHTADGSASSSSPADFSSKSDTTTIPAGSTSANGGVPYVDDERLESWHENFYVVIDCIRVGASTCGESDKARAGDTFGRMTIQDDEPKINVGPDQSATEGDEMSFPITLAQLREGQRISVKYETVDGSATANDDYEPKSGTLCWDDDEEDDTCSSDLTRTVTVKTLQDGDAEGNHAFTLELSEPSFAGIGDGSGQGLITDDDAFNVDAGPARSGESAVEVSFTGQADCPDSCTYSWDFGDGSTATGVTVKHRYDETGTYTVTLTVESSSGSSASDTTIATITDSGQVDRDSGTDREKTAVAVSSKNWTQADTVLLATGYKFPDALAAGPLAQKLDAPLLLTNPNGLPDEVKNELDRLNAQKVIILGGPQVVPQSQADELARDYTVERIAGINRFGTSADIATRVGATPTNEVTVALGEHSDPNRDAWPDALSAGSFASLTHPLPALLTHDQFVPQETLDALEDLGTERIFLLGGPVAISDAVESQLESEGYEVQRVFGNNRYDTSVEAAEIAMTRYPDGQVHPVFATGQKFPDGLSGGALAGKVGGPVVLVPKDDLSATPSVRTFLREEANRFDVGTVVGGTVVISDNVKNQARSDIDTT